MSVTRYARIEDGLVIEFFETDDISGKFHPSLVWVECPNHVTGDQNWLYADGEFIPAPQPGGSEG